MHTPRRTLFTSQQFIVLQRNRAKAITTSPFLLSLLYRAENRRFSTLRCTKTGGTQPKLSAACFVVQSCLADASFVVFSNYCLIGTRQSGALFLLRWALRLFANIRQNTAVHIQHMAVDKVAGRAGQEYRRTHEILGAAPAVGGGFGADEAVKGVTAAVGLAFAQRGGLGRGDIARADAVALNVILAVFGSNVAG